ncbi:transglycosylase SLT domain-containing protein, partial [Escherichia coli]|nr:transglycosylase SLT domain-containing protein [Escherichia coli]
GIHLIGGDHLRWQKPRAILDPETNINIGTSYLQYVYQQFGDNRIFSSAAYNAGPGRVRTWLGNSAGAITEKFIGQKATE